LKNKLLSIGLLTGLIGIFLSGCTPTSIQNQKNTAISSMSKPIMRDQKLLAPNYYLENFPEQVALLLPLSGDYKREGKSIQNGFLSAHYSLSNNEPRINKIRIYDTQKFQNSESAYNQAIEDGADFVVGPLLQDSVNDLAKKIAFRTPILTLNSLEDNQSLVGMYQFSLSSIDEAISTSNKVIIDQNKYGVIIAPDNEWGRQLNEIYTSTLESMGGVILDSQFYSQNEKDFTFELKDLLGISLSEKRYNRLSANLNKNFSFSPRRRQDVDFIFLVAADTASAKLLKSQLNYHLSGDEILPIYSTSTIYSYNSNLNDLNDVIFTDAPWVIDQQIWLKNLPLILRKYWPGDAIQSRQNAMGYDAYFLVAALNSLKNNSMQELNGATGQLYMEENGRIRRRLAWAQLINGHPKVQEQEQREQ
jgi:outer membrane PBP1 activator LpoA protein|tara:strand:+ start:4358 stop:5614 length:1257 start_codon:yes stop_codon:yes gene_type:complete